MSGVTYYKLEQRYEGDRTKGCGLTSAEVDANFHFLRGYDIKDVTLSDEGVLTFHRVNCDDIVITNFPEIIQEIADNAIASSEKPFNLTGEYDEETGELTLKLNGAELVVPGFDKTDFDFKLHVGQGLEGDGSKSKPIRLSLVNQTGFFAPVETVFDEENGEEYNGRASRFITKEQVSHLGLLYDFDNTKKLDAYLSEHGNGWRVPTEEDWEDLFNAYHCDGVADQLKDESFEDGPDTAFGARPIEFTNGKKYTAYWCIGEGDCGEGFYKGIKEDDPDVIENVAEAGRKNSIRLVKNNDLESAEVETICGDIYNTVRIGTLVWTTDNVGFENDEIKGTKPYGEGYVNTEDEYNADSVYAYFINEYDSLTDTISKKPLPANSVVMIHDYSGRTDEEWVVREENGEFSLVSRNDIIQEYIDNGIGKDVTTLTEITAAHQELIETLSSSAETLNSNINETNTNLGALSATVVTHDEKIAELEARADGAGSDASELAGRVAQNESEIAGLKEKTDKTNADLEALSGAVITSLTMVSDEFVELNNDLDTVVRDMISDVKVNGESLEKTDNSVNVEVPILSVQNDDKLLSVEDRTLKSEFRVEYVASANTIYFHGTNDVIIGEVDTKDFVVDGFLQSAYTGYDAVTGDPILVFDFNTDSGKQSITIPLTSLVTEYTVARGSENYLEIDGFEIAFKPNGLLNQYATNDTVNELSASTIVLDKKIGPGVKDKNGNPVSVSHKFTELEDTINDYTRENQLEFAEDFDVAGIIGVLGTGYYQNGNVIPAGTKIMDVLKNILQRELDPIGEMPKVKIEFLNDGEYEVGPQITPAYRITLTDGKYNYLDGTSANAEFSVTQATVKLVENGTITPNTATDVPTGTFDSYQVPEGTKVTLLANIDYESTYIPKSNLGNDRPNAKIPNGRFEFVPSENSITVFRPTYYASLHDGDILYDSESTITISDDVLALFEKYKVDGVVKNGIPKIVNVEEGAELVVILVPNVSNYTIEKIIDLDSGLDLIDRFVKKQTSIKTYTGDNGAGYTAYIFDPGTQLGANQYRIVSRYIEF